MQSIADGAVTLRCALEGDTPPRPAIDLLLALPRPKVMRRLWAQIAALGVGQIILTNAEKVERNYFDTHILTPETYRPLLIEGLQQARDTRLPVVSIHRQFKMLIEDQLDTLFGTGASGRRRSVGDEAAGRGRAGEQRTSGSCWRSDPKAAGTRSSSDCSQLTAFSRPAWARARCAPTPRASRCSRSRTAPGPASDFRAQISD